MSDTDNRWEFKAIAEKVLADEDITDYQRGYCHGQIDAADTMSEYLERQNQIAKAAPEMLEALKQTIKFLESIDADGWWFDGLWVIMDSCNNAIAKAEGK